MSSPKSSLYSWVSSSLSVPTVRVRAAGGLYPDQPLGWLLFSDLSHSSCHVVVCHSVMIDWVSWWLMFWCFHLLMSNDLFPCLSAICIFFGEVWWNLLPSYEIGLSTVILKFWAFFIYSGHRYLSLKYVITHILFQLVTLFFYPFNNVFQRPKFFIFIRPFFFFHFMHCSSIFYLRNLNAAQGQKNILLFFLIENCTTR